MKSDLKTTNCSQEVTENLENFFRCIAICNDCIAVKDPKNDSKIKYNGPSVDEVVLNEMAQEAGIGFFCERESSSVNIQMADKVEKFNMVKAYPFDSVRKCMSVVVEHPTEQNKVICFVKGADTNVLPMIAQDTKEAADCKKLVEDNVEEFACKGLRTLCFAMKIMDWEQGKDPETLNSEDVECGLTLLAATGVEDLLQENVKECISDFRKAGINVWMLTGDKGATAKEIGVSCGLVTPVNSQNHLDGTQQTPNCINTDALVVPEHEGEVKNSNLILEFGAMHLDST